MPRSKSSLVKLALFLDHEIDNFYNRIKNPRREFLSVDIMRKDLSRIKGINKDLDKIIDKANDNWSMDDMRIGTLYVTEGESSSGEGSLTIQIALRMVPSSIGLEEK